MSYVFNKYLILGYNCTQHISTVQSMAGGYSGSEIKNQTYPRSKTNVFLAEFLYWSTICPGSSDPFYIESYNIKLVTTSWTHSKSTARLTFDFYTAYIAYLLRRRIFLSACHASL